jgi:hypothetical protein
MSSCLMIYKAQGMRASFIRLVAPYAVRDEYAAAWH